MLLPLITLSLAPTLLPPLPLAPQTTTKDTMGGEPGTANFNYTYAEFDAVFFELDAPGVDSEIGFQLLGSARVWRDLFVRASYLDVGGDAETSLVKFGAGWAFPIQERLDGYGLFQIGRVDVHSADDTGWLLEGGVRYAATEQIELNALLEIVDFEDSEIGLGLGGRYAFTPQLSAGLNFETIDDFADIFYLGLRYQF
jgi:opacity protein-like surface antigen